MPSPRWLAWMETLYRGMLRLYPVAFQRRFAGEMTQVFAALNLAEYHRSGSGGALRLGLLAFADGLRAVLRQWWTHWVSRRIAMEDDRIDLHGGLKPLPPAQTALAVLPFVLYGLACLLERVWQPVMSDQPLPFWEVTLKTPYVWFGIFSLAGLLAGLLRGFPRWAQPYLVWTLYFCWWWNMSTYGFRWDWKVWLALLAVLLLALLIRRSLRPLAAILRALWQDWTLPSFFLFVLYSATFILFDENHHPALPIFISAATLAAAAGAWAYYRLSSAIPRVLALAAALLVLALLSTWSYATWDYRAYYNLQPGPRVEWATLLVTLGLGLLMLLPALLARWRGKLTLKRSA